MLLCKDIDSFSAFLKSHGIPDIWEQMHWNGCLQYDNKSIIWDMDLNPVYKKWSKEECSQYFNKHGITFSATGGQCGKFTFIDDIDCICYIIKIIKYYGSEDEIVEEYDSTNGDSMFTKVIDIDIHKFDIREDDKLFILDSTIIEKDGKFYKKIKC